MSIASVLSEVSSEKIEIGRLVDKLSTFTSSTDYSPRIIRQMEAVQRETIIDMFRDIDLRIKSEFDISNSLSVMGMAMTNLFGGELQKLEKDIQYLESYIDSYSFISGEDDLYNSSFIENFDNDQNSFMNENSTLSIPDRDGISFGANMMAHVNQSTGKLNFSSQYELSLVPVNKSNIKSLTFETNFPSEYISSDTGINNILNNVNSKSWSISAKTPFAIKESLLDSEKYINFKNNIITQPSAQVAVNVEFVTPISLSRIRLIPTYSLGLEVSQVIIETEDSQNVGPATGAYKRKAVLRNPVVISKNSDIDFDDSHIVKSMTIILSQTNYIRTKISPVQSEINSKMISSIVNAARQRRMNNYDSLQDFVIKFFLKDTEKTFLLRNKKLYSYNYTNYYPTSLSETNFGAVQELARNNYFSDIDSFNKFKNTSMFSNIIFSIISYTLGARLRSQNSSTYIESNVTDRTKPVRNMTTSGFLPVGDSNTIDRNLHFISQSVGGISKEDATQMLNATEPTNMYEYNISIGGIFLFEKLFRTAVSPTKSVFMSKKINTNGRPLKVKMLGTYFEELLFSQDDPGKDATSVEFSITTEEFPTSELNWTPVMPYGESFVRSEILIPNSNGEATLRFDPLEESVVMYYDGKRKEIGSYLVNQRSVKILQFNPSIKYFVSYSPKYLDKVHEIQLNPNGLAVPVLVTPNVNGANGERFSSTAQGNRIRLIQDPYVDRVKLVNSIYSPYSGTVTSSATSAIGADYSNYSPVKVFFEDGSRAINITNYTLDNQIESFYETDDTLFIQYADTILFNKEINKPFRVLYQYIPDSFRYRIIFRSLNNSEQNYSVDRLIFKFSTETRDNTLLRLMKYDNLFKNKSN
jgi:hypothetical protein